MQEVLLARQEVMLPEVVILDLLASLLAERTLALVELAGSVVADWEKEI